MIKKINGFLALTLLPFSAVFAFSDIKVTDSLYVSTTYLSTAKVISGYEDKTYKPQNIINRAEALKLILVATGRSIDTKSSAVFSDVPADSWFAKYVNYAAQSAIVSGDGTTGQFVPARSVNKAEFLKMLLKSFEVDPLKFEEKLNIKSVDVPAGSWFEPYIDFAVKFEVMAQDKDKKAFPDKLISRGESAQMIFNLLRKGGDLNPNILIRITESHLVSVVRYINEDRITDAAVVVTMAERFAQITQELPKLAKNKVVLGMVKTVESLKHLVGAHSARKNGLLDDVIIGAKSAWSAADEAAKINPDITTMTDQIKLMASNLAVQAREAKAKVVTP